MRSRIAVIYGTRPEVIKMAPVVHALQRTAGLEPVICVTGQHRALLDQMMQVFNLESQFDLNLMTECQSLAQITTGALEGISRTFDIVKPDFVLVQGDTTTSFAASLAAFYYGLPVGHIEAGLRSRDGRNPFPEEINRRLTTQIANVHFAPTRLARLNLLREGVHPGHIHITGNTVVDALQWVLARGRHNGWKLPVDVRRIDWNNDLPLLVTTHRRENWGEGVVQVCEALRRLLAWDDRVRIVFPVHPNPAVHDGVARQLGGLDRVHLTKPLPYPEFIAVMSRCRAVITDSGGIQEEVASLSKPVIITRERTERPEVLACGLGVLTGTDPDRILAEVQRVLSRPPKLATSPFGDGRAASRIVHQIAALLN
jgi:UDP-N-acetylglucosamine 2-epimerase (non-hydrolysing)